VAWRRGGSWGVNSWESSSSNSCDQMASTHVINYRSNSFVEYSPPTRRVLGSWRVFLITCLCYCCHSAGLCALHPVHMNYALSSALCHSHPSLSNNPMPSCSIEVAKFDRLQSRSIYLSAMISSLGKNVAGFAARSALSVIGIRHHEN
jgi:hypothetical protein